MFKSLESLIDLGKRLSGLAQREVVCNGRYIYTSSTGQAGWYDRFYPLLDKVDIDEAIEISSDPVHPMWITFAREDHPALSTELAGRNWRPILPAHTGMVYRPEKRFEEDIEVIKIDKERLIEWDTVRSAGFGNPKEPENHAKLLASDNTFYYGALADGKIVSTGFMNVNDDWTNGGIFSIATPEEHRGKGYAPAVMKHIINEALEMEVPLLSLQASDAGRKVYSRLGFIDECTIMGWGKAAL